MLKLILFSLLLLYISFTEAGCPTGFPTLTTLSEDEDTDPHENIYSSPLEILDFDYADDRWMDISESSIHKDILRVASFNAYWLFNETRTSMSTWPWKNEQELAIHHERISNTLSTLNTDILNMVEVSPDCAYLHRLVQASTLSPDQRIYLVDGKDTATKQNVALITPFSTALVRTETRIPHPLPHSKCGYCTCSSSLQSSGVSKHYFSMIKLRPQNSLDWIPLLVVGVHLKAIPTDPTSCSQREAQAMVIAQSIKDILNRMQKKFPTKRISVMVMGDFNDYDSAFPDKNRNQPTSRALEIIRQSLNLTNVMSFFNESQTYSHWWDKNNNNHIEPDEQSLIDHILVSSHILPSIVEVTHYPSILYPNGDLMTSDHWPVGFSFNITTLHSILSEMDDPTPIYTCGNRTSMDPQVCNGRGACVGEDNCQCHDGYMGSDCLTIACHGIPQNDARVCSGRGQCVDRNQCECTDPNYDGPNCENRNFPICFGVSSLESEKLVCSGQGRCISDNNCDCRFGYAGEVCQYSICFGHPSNSSNTCSGHGKCILPDTCVCDKNYAGQNCQHYYTTDSSDSSSSSDTKLEIASIIILVLTVIIILLLLSQTLTCIILIKKRQPSINTSSLQNMFGQGRSFIDLELSSDHSDDFDLDDVELIGNDMDVPSDDEIKA